MTEKLDTATLLRAGHVLFGAFAARTGPRAPRRLAMPLALLAALGLGAAAGSAAMSGGPKASDIPAAERERIEAVVHAYILDHPEILPEAMERLRDRETTKAIDQNRAEIETPYAGAWDGAKDGDVTLVEFFDYACGYCRAAAPYVARLAAEDKGLRIVYRELPILGEESVMAARVALLAADTGKYSAFHKAMYDHEAVDKTSIADAATRAGIDGVRVKAILGSRGTADEFTKNVALAQTLGARGTPMFVVGDQILHGEVGYDALKAAIAKTRAGKKASDGA